MVCRKSRSLSFLNISIPTLMDSIVLEVVAFLAALRALLIDGINIPISREMMKITVNSSISEKAAFWFLRGCAPRL